MSKPKQIVPESDKRWLHDGEVIWRYVPLRTLFFYLNGQVFIPSVAKLRAGDPFEGEFYENIACFNAAFQKHYGDAANRVDEWIIKELCSDPERKLIQINKNDPNGANAAAVVLRKHYFDFVRRTRFAWCWFQSNRESAAMCSVYGNQGVAIKTTVGRLSALLETAGGDFICGRMTYVDYESGVSTEFDPSRESDYYLLLRPFFLKRKEFESEQEIRFVTAGNDRDERKGILLTNLVPNEWISAIRLWPGLDAGEAASILKAVEHFMPQVDCQKSELFSGPDGSFVELIDVFNARRGSAADSGWTDGQDGIPAPLKAL
jgi:hypothetical protein